MSLSCNNTDIKNITYNGTDLTKVIYNGVVVWEKTSGLDWSKYPNIYGFSKNSDNKTLFLFSISGLIIVADDLQGTNVQLPLRNPEKMLPTYNGCVAILKHLEGTDDYSPASLNKFTIHKFEIPASGNVTSSSFTLATNNASSGIYVKIQDWVSEINGTVNDIIIDLYSYNILNKRIYIMVTVSYDGYNSDGYYVDYTRHYILSYNTVTNKASFEKSFFSYKNLEQQYNINIDAQYYYNTYNRYAYICKYNQISKQYQFYVLFEQEENADEQMNNLYPINWKTYSAQFVFGNYILPNTYCSTGNTLISKCNNKLCTYDDTKLVISDISVSDNDKVYFDGVNLYLANTKLKTIQELQLTDDYILSIKE